MSEQEFESYLRLMSRFLQLNEEQRKTIGLELRGHMEERLDELLSRGFTREDAIHTILDEFGDAAALSSEFSRIGLRRKWIMRTTAGTAGIAAVILFVSFLLPENRQLPSPAYSVAGQNMVSAEPSARPAAAQPEPARVAEATIPVWPKQEAGTEEEVRDRLASKRVTVEFAEGTGFEEVLNFLQEQGGTTIAVNWNALSTLGVDRTTDTLGLRSNGTRLDTLIALLLANVGGPEGALSYSIEDNMLWISTSQALDRKTITRIYDCGDLIGEPTPEALAVKMAKAGEGGTPGPGFKEEFTGGFGGGGMMPGRSSRPSRTTPMEGTSATKAFEQERMSELEKVIKENVMAGTWAPEGAVGSMSSYDGLLVVTAPRRAHEGVYKLLSTMHQALAARPQPKQMEAAISEPASARGNAQPSEVDPVTGESLAGGMQPGRTMFFSATPGTGTTQPAGVLGMR